MRRKLFLGSTLALGAVASAPEVSAQAAGTRAGNKRSSQFFEDPAMNFVLLIVLGQAASGCGDVGTTLAIFDQIEDGNAGSAFSALTAAGYRCIRSANAARAAGHRVSARDLYFQGSTYLYAGLYFCDGMREPQRMPGLFHDSRAAADSAFALLERPAEKINIPYAGTFMPGYFVKRDSRETKRPLLILVNGSDGSVVDMWAQGGKAALERGYNILIFDGPGQGTMLWDRHTAFRYDYEAVVSPVVDYALTRHDVDKNRIAIQGISQGGYWVPRAIAFEHRIAAAIADPGVYDIGAAWWTSLPAPLRALLDHGQKKLFDGIMTHLPPKRAADLTFRARPYGFTSYFDLFMSIKKYTMANVVDKIRTPLLIADPDNEQFFPGQPQELFHALSSPRKALIRFTVAEGADGHCEPAAPQLRSQKVFDWLNDQLR